MKTMSIKRTWITNEEGAIYELTINGTTYKAIETTGAPLALDGAIDFDDEALSLIDGIIFIDEDEFEAALNKIIEAGGSLSDDVELDEISSEGVREYFRGIVLTLGK